MSSQDLAETALKEAKDEMTDYTTYKRLAASEKGKENKDMFEKLSSMERRHYDLWMRYLPKGTPAVGPSNRTVYLTLFLRRVFGASFAIKFLERREAKTVGKYESLKPMVPPDDQEAFQSMIEDEKGHETAFADIVAGTYVKYISFIVLGLADALVEIAGIHAGSLGIYNSTELTGLAGIVAGAAASLAMASAAFAQAKQGFEGRPSLAAAYTGGSYFVAAVVLALPYFLTKEMLSAISLSLAFGLTMIAFVSWYNSIISSGKFVKDFSELAGVMLGATVALFIFGNIIRALFGITI
ncbi:MAG TPA: VIT1/CCC1 family protein [Nitrososphaerales archaeon]|nr:VIT1/CCC1 family protein [Nitrososphaerales archaeon]